MIGHGTNTAPPVFAMHRVFYEEADAFGNEAQTTSDGFTLVHTEIVQLLDAARSASAWSVNGFMTASYWDVGRRIVEFEQKVRG